MSRPTTRLLAALELLQTHGRLRGSELARRLEVDVRTVRRYIVALEELGIPITAERGRDGAYLLVAGFKLPPMMFTDDEAQALAVGLLAVRELGLAATTPAVASAQAKLERVMPAARKRRVRAIAETVTLELGRPAAPAAPGALLALSAAAHDRTRVCLQYRTAEHVDSERELDPYGLACRHGHWYVVGMCHLRRGLRSFRLDRIRAVQPLATAFTRPPAFDLLGYLTRSIARLPRGISIEVLLATDLETAQRELAPELGILEPTPAGLRLRAETNDLDWFARELARLPCRITILRPAALRTALRATAQRLLDAADSRD